MIKNYYYLIAGILAIIFAFTHSWNGQVVVLPILDLPTISAETKTIYIYIWNIITAENLVFGIAFLVMSQYKDLSKVRFTALVIAAMLIIRLIIINVTTLVYNPTGVNSTMIDSVAIAVYVVLIVLGTRVNNLKSITKPI
jgi:hypothetical protein